jgi:hypothetical protein
MQSNETIEGSSFMWNTYYLASTGAGEWTATESLLPLSSIVGSFFAPEFGHQAELTPSGSNTKKCRVRFD